MFLVGDSQPRRRFPAATLFLIVVNLGVFAWQLSLGPAVGVAIATWGVVPAMLAAVLSGEVAAWSPVVATLVTHQFLHGGVLHLLGNLWTLWIFGDNVEEALGRGRYVVFYLVCGAVAALTQVVTSWGEAVPLVGASGAISGVMGAYLLLFRRSWVTLVIPVVVIPFFLRVPAFVYLILWLALQWVAGLTSLAKPAGGGGVAWWAHLGGFAAGVLLLRVLGPKAEGGRRIAVRKS